jgi:hypothetical protein
MKLNKRITAAAAVGTMALLSVAGPASALASSYTILRGASVYATAGHNLWPAGVDDATVSIALPFPVTLYGTKARTSVNVSSNGNLQFGTAPSISWSNTCLPDTSGLSGPVIMPYWDDLLIRNQAASGDGVFTKTTGKAPNKQFIISWKGVLFGDPNFPVRAEVVLYQGKSFFETRYGAGDGANATIGIENFARTDVSQWSCNDAVTAPDPGQSLRFSYTP